MIFPSDQLAGLLSGTLQPDQVSAAVLSWSRLTVHYMALEVLKAQGQDGRRRALEAVPEHLRERVEFEALRVYKLRRL